MNEDATCWLFFFLTASFIVDHESNYRMAEPSCFVFIMDQNNFESQCEVSIESYFLQSATVSYIFGWVRSLLCGVGLSHLLIMAVKCESAKLDLFQNNWLWLNSCCLSVEGNCGHYTLVLLLPCDEGQVPIPSLESIKLRAFGFYISPHTGIWSIPRRWELQE